MSEHSKDRLQGHAVPLFKEHTLLQRYLVVGHVSKGLELPNFLASSGEEVLPIFSSEEAAREFLSRSLLGKGWCVRGFSGGELVSMLFAFHPRMKGVLLDPHPGAFSDDVMVSLVSWDTFVGSLLGTRGHQPAAGTRS